MTDASSPATANRIPPERSATDHYDGVVRFFHWAVVTLVIVQYGTEFVPAGALGVFTGNRLTAWHLSVGPTILALMVIRLAWRLTHAVPPPPADLSVLLRIVSRATHWLFYAILLLLPVLGWVAASGYGAQPYLFGLIPLPALVARDDGFAKAVGRVHGVLAWTLLAIIALHVAGALYHAVIKRDGVVKRMVPGLG